LQKQNYFRDITTINIKIIKGSRAIVSNTQIFLALLLEKVTKVLGFLAQGVGIFSTPIKVRGLLAFETASLIRLERIYNFQCSMLVYTPFALCFITLRGVFMDFQI
jgi:hypothetical protein